VRFLHTADWHLGRLFHGAHLTEDQAHVLGQLVAICKDHRPDAVLVAGDIYDRAVPPPEAVELLDEVLSELVLGLKLPVVLIAGNHDSPGRLHFGSKLLDGQRLHVRGHFRSECPPIVLGDDHGPVHVYPIPYAEPPIIRACLASESVIDHDSGMRALLAKVRQSHVQGARAILIAHAFVAGGQGCESERPLSVGTAGTVDASCFAGFNYVALGHLHRPQRVSFDGCAIHYSGSLLKYSFEEADHAKGVTLVQMAADGSCETEFLALTPRREVRRISGTMAELLGSPADNGHRDDYLEVTLLDEGPVFDAVGRLRELYPNVAQLHRANLAADGGIAKAVADHRSMSEVELFRAFYQHVAGKPLEAAHEAAFIATVEASRRAEREAMPVSSS
jgi:DNA repair protein SbcD/Mre11